MSQKSILFVAMVMAVGCTSAQLKAGLTLAEHAACIAVKPVCSAAELVCGPILESTPPEAPTSGGESVP